MLEPTIAPTMSCTLSALIVTSPEDTVKSVPSNVATPALVSVASSAAIVMVSSDTVVSTPSPPVKVRVPPVENVSFEPLSADKVKDVLSDAVVADVTLPFASIVTTGIAVELP